MSTKTTGMAQEETADLLAAAVAELAGRAIRPELDPFQQEVRALCAQLKALLGDLGENQEAWEGDVRTFRASLTRVGVALDQHAEELGQTISLLRSEEERTAFKREVAQLCGALRERTAEIESAQARCEATVLRVEAAIQNPSSAPPRSASRTPPHRSRRLRCDDNLLSRREQVTDFGRPTQPTQDPHDAGMRRTDRALQRCVG